MIFSLILSYLFDPMLCLKRMKNNRQIENLFGKIPVNSFHVTSPQNIKSIASILGKKKSISTFTKANKSSQLAKGRGVQTGSGGVIFYVEGLLLGRKAEDFDTVPDRTGRRWVMGQHIFGTGSQFVRGAIKKAGLPDYSEWNEIESKVEEKIENNPKYDDLGFRDRMKIIKKELAPMVQKHIKKYIDTTNKLLKKHKDRHSCEISVTVFIVSDGEHEWPIYMDGKKVNLTPGDGVIYRGCDIEHWREPYKGDYHMQVFLHYVDANGKYANHKGDVINENFTE